MDKDILYEILNSEYENLSFAEIEGILNEELDKSPEEMDTDLVELCLDALNSAGEKKQNGKRLRVRVSRILIAAVIFVLLIGIAIPVCAKYFSVSFSDGVVKFYDDCFSVDLSDSDDSIKDIVGTLEQDGLANVKLPDMLFKPETKVSNYICKDINGNSNINFEFQNGDIQGFAVIVKYEYSDFISNQKKVTTKFKYVNEIDKGDYTILVFSDDKKSFLYYAFDGSEYDISINCDYETACKIAESL
ncbi:MAG: hypothetical protein ACI4IK_01395 [Eubacterium sp.]